MQAVRARLYAVILSAAFIIILLNALYGHWAFSAVHPESIARYSVYVHLQPEWRSYPASLLFEVTNVWGDGSGADGEYYELPDESDSHNYNQIREIWDREFVELKHRFSDCRLNWQPILYRYALDSIQGQFDAASGAAVSDHPYAIMYQNHTLADTGADRRSGYLQFIPACSSTQNASYQYSVRVQGAEIPLDVYFVPDASAYDRFVEGPDSPPHYPGCSAILHTSFSGSCSNVSPGSGLLIWVPDDLELALTKITVNLREIPAG